jgi:hypothetical protein
MTNTLTDPAAAAAQAPCFVCLGDRTDPATGQPCPRCRGTGTDPDPAAPTGIAVAS